MTQKELEKTVLRAADRAADSIRETAGHAVRAVRTVPRRGNPLLVRWKFDMKDVFFRRDEPERELFRFEIGGDTALWVPALCLILAALWCASKLARLARRIRRRRRKKEA